MGSSRDGIRGEKVPSTSIIDLIISNQALGPSRELGSG